MKIIIVGGVAGGATAAARLRRLNEDADIIMFERGEYVSFANCGLPYYLGGVISRRDALFVSDKETIEARYNIDVRTRSEVTSIDRDNKRVTVKNHATGETYEETYDKLLLSTGSSPFVPPMEGTDLPNVFTLWTIDDTDRIAAFMEDETPQKAVVVGGGFIGLEMAENLVERGLDVTLVELMDQIMPPFDPDMAKLLEAHLVSKGVRLILGKGVEAIVDDGRTVRLNDGTTIATDMTMLSIGVRPNSGLAKDCGLDVGPRGHIVVSDTMQTSDPDIYAVGDVVEVNEPILGGKTAIPLAGPANRQGRLVGAHMVDALPKSSYPGSIGTSVAKIFDLTAASTGVNEKSLKRQGKVYKKDYFIALVHPSNHVGYYPGAMPMTIKLIFDASGRVLGAQIVGMAGVDKRIDVIATTIHFKGTVQDLTHLELAYAPPYGAAKDPVNFAGFVAENILAGITDAVTVEEYLADPEKYTVIDVREEVERLTGKIDEARSIPLPQLRSRLDELDRDQHYLIHCAVGLRGYIAERILKQNGFKASNMAGGFRTYEALTQTPKTPAAAPKEGTNDMSEAREAIQLDVCGMACPGPIVQVGKAMEDMEAGETVRVKATDPGFARDIDSWCENTGNTLVSCETSGGYITAVIQKGTGRPTPVAGDPTSKDKTMIVFAGDFDKVMAAFIIALGAAAMGDRVHMFFTFWGLSALRKDVHVDVEKGFMDKMFAGMLPKGTKGMGLSQMNMMGVAPKMMRKVMQDKGITSLEDLVAEAAASPLIEMTACQMTMDVMGLKEEELLDGVNVGGVASMLNDADHSQFTLFIS